MFRNYFLLLVFSVCGLFARVMQTDEVKAVIRIRQFIAAEMMRGPPNGIVNPPAKLVRLSFHDCVGGCDGCLNLNNLENNGLQQTYSRINNIYDNEDYNSTGMSRADFIALAGTVAVRYASSQQEPPITLKYGRQDCPTSPNTNATERFPNAHGDLDEVFDVFQKTMNMTVRQVVAIIGAHTLGAAAINRSGFRGPWVLRQNVFDNEFYRQLWSPNNDWFQEKIESENSPFHPQPRYQWTVERDGASRGPRNLLMLNTDVALWKNIQPNHDGQEMDESCRDDLNNCTASITADIVTEFANNNTAFQLAFGSAFQVLIENGYPNGRLSTAENGTSIMTPDSGPRVAEGSIALISAVIFFIHFISF